MKEAWLRYSAKIDALGLRERVAVFIMLAVVLVALFDSLVLEQQFARETMLSQQIEQDQSQTRQMQTQIQSVIEAAGRDPNTANRKKLDELLHKYDQMRGSLQDMQKGLIAPDKMTTLLEDILRQNGKLHLASLHTLPVTDLLDAGKPADKADKTEKADKAAAPPGTNLVYKHGVEMVIEGSYLDMVEYMTALEHMPWQLFWGNARLTSDASGKLSLSLTLYTLSLDKNLLMI